MDGIEATGRILRVAPSLPVIGFTAHAMAEERERCRTAGMVDCVVKPVDMELLVDALLRHTGGRPLNAARAPRRWPQEAACDASRPGA
ncbi:MAG: response regulator [Pseudomonadota bacterium]|nr:response regulator [Pseudomonadota bacterium]